MNQICLIGRLTRELELIKIKDGQVVINNTLAVARKVHVPDHEIRTDFIPIVAWNYQADCIVKHARKGQKLCVVGQMRSRTYEDKDGQKRFVVECLVEHVSFFPDILKPDFQKNDTIVNEEKTKEHHGNVFIENN